ncbi:MAG: transporter substrate-binding domain-containing protein [Oscillospiraceae bacterium]|nr:transporter substrate-binding domain-containing protein [Oscillospiraceae bacterium]
MKKIIAFVLCAAVLLCAAAAFGEDYTIATDTAFRPFVFTDKSGELVGIDVEILAAIAQDQGFTYSLEPMGWDASIAACQAGMKDGMIAGASITEERLASGWIFSDAYFNASQSMAVAQGVSITSFEELRGHSVSVKAGTLSKDYADSLAEQYGFKVVTYGSSIAVYMAVTGGECAACFDDTPALEDYILNGGVFLQLVEGTSNEGTDYGFVVFSPEKQELIDKFNAGLANIKASGEYDRIMAKYLGQ